MVTDVEVALVCIVVVIQVGVVSRQEHSVLTKPSASDTKFEKSVASRLGSGGFDVDVGFSVVVVVWVVRFLIFSFAVGGQLMIVDVAV